MARLDTSVHTLSGRIDFQELGSRQELGHSNSLYVALLSTRVGIAINALPPTVLYMRTRDGTVSFVPSDTATPGDG